MSVEHHKRNTRDVFSGFCRIIVCLQIEVAYCTRSCLLLLFIYGHAWFNKRSCGKFALYLSINSVFVTVRTN